MSGFRTRVVLASALSAAILVPTTVLVSMHLLTARITDVRLRTVEVMGAAEAERCRAAPGTWRSPASDAVMTVIAGDAARPDRSDLPPDLRSRLAAGEPFAAARALLGGGGVAYRRVGEAGPCSMVLFRWQPPPEARSTVIAGALLASALAVGLAIGLVAILALRPLLARLGRVRDAADTIGDPDGYTAMDDSTGDAISIIAEGVDAAHARIVSDARRLADRSRALEEHLADVAHDLRTPIASLQLALSRAVADRSAPHLAGAIRDVVYIAGLVANLRLATRLEHGFDPGSGDPRVDLGAIVDAVCARFQLLGEQRGVEVVAGRPDEPVVVACDPASAEQAVANLVHNAVEHGESGGHVALVLDRRAGRFTLTVLDDGPGVAPEMMPQLVARSVSGRAEPGRGLGVAITHEICRRVGWSLSFDTAEPRGLRAVITGEEIEIRPVS